MSAETLAYFAAETHLDEAVIVPRLRKELKR
jgi:hypothetical protein